MESKFISIMLTKIVASVVVTIVILIGIGATIADMLQRRAARIRKRFDKINGE